MSIPILEVPGLKRSNGYPFRVNNLLGESSKARMLAVEMGYLSTVMFLSPHMMANEIAATLEGQLILKAVEQKFYLPGALMPRVSRHNSCPKADHCSETCLAVYAGHLRFRDCQLYEFAKTCMFLADRVWFTRRVVDEVRHLSFGFPGHPKYDQGLAVRLNGGSDILWEKYLCDMGKNIFELTDRPYVHYYDYTKIPHRMLKYLARFRDGDFPYNYHLTFSRGSDNWADCINVLEYGGNVSVVSRERPEFGVGQYTLPSGRKVDLIDGDEHDFRFLDTQTNPEGGAIVVLKPKGKEAKADTSGFVVDSLRDVAE